MKIPLGRALAISLLVLAAALMLSVAIGPGEHPAPRTIWSIFADRMGLAAAAVDETGTFSTILLDIRLPHAVLLLLTGAALAGSGAGYQGLFRNPLADPYLIGVASGAGLGAVVAMSIRWPEDLAGAVRDPGSLLYRRGADGHVRVQPGADRPQRSDDHADPGGGGGQLLCHVADFVPDAAIQRATAASHRLAAGRLTDERMAARARPAALCV